MYLEIKNTASVTHWNCKYIPVIRVFDWTWYIFPLLLYTLSNNNRYYYCAQDCKKITPAKNECWSILCVIERLEYIFRTIVIAPYGRFSCYSAHVKTVMSNDFVRLFLLHLREMNDDVSRYQSKAKCSTSL